MKCPFKHQSDPRRPHLTIFGECDPECAMLVHCPDNSIAHTACAFAVMASSDTSMMGFSPVNEIPQKDASAV